jgi:type I restriction enzyme M protein
VLRTKKIDPVFLAIQLDSLVGQMQVKKFQRGSSGQIELYPDDIKKFIVWDAPADIQEEIRQKITESFALRRQSKHLLDCAKRAVEIAIEQDEQAAIDWLERETEEKSCGAD